MYSLAPILDLFASAFAKKGHLVTRFRSFLRVAVYWRYRLLHVLGFFCVSRCPGGIRRAPKGVSGSGPLHVPNPFLSFPGRGGEAAAQQVGLQEALCLQLAHCCEGFDERPALAGGQLFRSDTGAVADGQPHRQKQ